MTENISGKIAGSHGAGPVPASSFVRAMILAPSQLPEADINAVLHRPETAGEQ